MKELLIKALKSRIITADTSATSALLEALNKNHSRLKERDVLVITSKVVAVTQGRVKKIRNRKDFNNLVKNEADAVIGQSQVTLTLKNGIFIPWAGIDRSNVAGGYAVLWPQKPFQTAALIQKELKKKYGIRRLGVIISDSHCIPLRKGVTALALGYAGFRGVNDLRGRKDLYGNTLKVTQQNIADMLAAAAHLVMGEAAESTPFALIRNAPVVFTAKTIRPSEPLIEAKNCLFAPLYKNLEKI